MYKGPDNPWRRSAMLVITDNALSFLKNELLHLYESQRFCRVLVLSTSEHAGAHTGWILKFSEIARSVLGSDDGTIFLLENGDTVIASAALNTRSHAVLKDKIGTALPALNVVKTALYEMPVDYTAIRNRFFPAPSAAAQPPVEEREQTDKTAETKERIDLSHLLGTLNDRRQKRDRPLALVIEDDALSQRLVTKTLEGRYETVAVKDGQDAIHNYLYKAPDIVFLDIGLPDVNGLDLLGKLLSIDPKAEIIMLSGNGSRDNVLKAMTLGAKGFVGKPFSQERVLQYSTANPFYQQKQASLSTVIIRS